MKPDLSIIVPIYNGEKYIIKRINTLKKIKNLRTELIFINDGSTDHSAEILKNLEQNTKNLIFIDQKENRGVSSARNLGLKKARGNYITFLDIDDLPNPKMYEKLYQYAIKNNLDISMCNFYEYFETTGEKVNSKYHYATEIITNPEIARRYLLDKISNALWDKLYRRELLKGLTFNETLAIGEDILFNLETLPKAKTLGFLNEYLYGYVQQPSSAMHTISQKLTQYQSVLKNLPEDQLTYLKTTFPDELEFFRCQMLTRTLHAISLSATTRNRKDALNLLRPIFTKNTLTRLLKNPDLPKSTKLELYLLKTLGLSTHLRLTPIYKYLRNKTR